MPYIGKDPGTGLRGRFIYTATAGQTSFTGADSLGRTLTYTDSEYTDVYLNGVKLDKTDYTATSGTSVVLDSGASAGDILEILAFDTFGLFSGDFAQDVTVAGDLTVSGTTTVAATTITGDLSLADKIVHTGDTNTAIRFSDADTVTVETGASERLKLSSAGFLDLGTTTDAATVSSTATDYQLQLGSAQSTTGDIGRNISFGFSGTTTAAINTVDAGSGTAQSLAFYTHNASSLNEAMRIDSNGNILLGTTTTGTTSGGAYFDPESLDRTVLFTGSSSASSGVTLVAFNNPNGIVGGISTAASSTSFNTSSDYRLKENVTDITGAIDRVKTLAPKRFNFKVDPDNTVDGFLAHEAQEVVPEAVTGTKDQTEAIGDLKDADGNVTESKVVKPDTLQEGYTWTETETRPVYQGIDQAKLVPVLTAALQEAIAEIETLKTKVAALEAE
tara:strand:- start:1418 stop:2755 length:1338 start_codon:yes stop_codon:yes gene_type:complete